MRALTLWPEWAWAMVALGKDVENRPWQPRGVLLGERIAIHAGKYVGGHPGRGDDRQRAIAALEHMAGRAGWQVRSIGQFDRAFTQAGETVEFRFDDIPRGSLVLVATLLAVITDCGSQWAVPGQNHLVLGDRVPLSKPIPARGAMGFWPLAHNLEIQVTRQLDAARVAGDRWEAF